eukprot:3987359-Amphidinium_carterae.2
MSGRGAIGCTNCTKQTLVVAERVLCRKATEGLRPVEWAAWGGHVSAVRALIAARTPVGSALHWAASRGSYELVRVAGFATCEGGLQ